MIRSAVTNKLLSEESYGSTPGKMAQSASIQKIIATDQLRLERRAGGIFDCDASGCYDRILPPLAAIHLRALGLQKSIGVFLARLMFLSKRYVKTGHGISETNIGTTKKKVLHGIGQGNGGGPAMWIAHLTVMFSTLSAVCLGFVMNCVQTMKQVVTVGTGYVDDVTLGLSLPKKQKQTEQKVRQNIKKMSQWWEKLLYITGGRLELSKCYWVPVTWKWSQGKPSMVKKLGRNKELILRESETQAFVVIPRKLGMDAVKRLGVHVSCDGKWTEEFRYWQKFSADIGHKLAKATVDRLSGYLVYHSIWLAKVRYSAAVTGFTSNQMNTIQKKILSPCLSAAGFSSKLPRAVVFGIRKFGGMEWDKLSVLVVYEKIKFLIGSIRLQDKVGQMLQIQLSWLQLFAGTSKKILEADNEISYLPIGWVQNLHRLLVEYRVKIEIRDLWILTKQRVDDVLIMDMVQSRMPKWAWSGINRCRLFMQANTLADITLMDGQTIPETVRKMEGPIRNTRLQFPVQFRPGKNDVLQWQYLVDSISVEGRLFVPLGQWTRTPDQIFPYMQNIERSIVYKKVPMGWDVFGLKGDRYRYFYKLNLRVNTIPEGSMPVQVIDTNRYVIVPRSTDYDTRLSVDSTSPCGDESRVLGKFMIDSTQMERLKQCWYSSPVTLVAATDGGLKDGIGTSSYALFFTEEFPPIIQGCAGEHQSTKSASSTRQELLGQLGVEYWLRKLVIQWGFPRISLAVTLVTDSKASMDILANTKNLQGIKDTFGADMDIGLEIARVQNEHNHWMTRQVVKVESHIEVDKAPNKFYWACNEIVDKLATEARLVFRRNELENTKIGVLRGARAGCVINNRVVNNNLYGELKEHISGEALRQFLMLKYNWTQTTFDMIDWEEHDRQLKAYSIQHRVTLLKYIHGWLASQRRLFREKHSESPMCPLCGHEEDRFHLFRCSHSQLQTMRRQRWDLFLREINQSTEPGFTQIFQAGIDTVLGREAPSERIQYKIGQ